MNEVAARFKRALKDDMPISKMLFDMSIYKTDPKYLYYCIIEGKSDVLFYDNINVEPFCEKKTAFIFKDYVKNDPIVGKSAVVSAYIGFCRMFKKDIKRCIFIVDHDYDGLECKIYGLPEAANTYINVLPVYSFENYFLSADNMRVVFRQANVNSQIANLIRNSLMDIKRETIDYFSCKCVLTQKSRVARYKKLRSIKPGIKETDLFRLNIKNSPPLPMNTIKSEIERIKSGIDGFSELQEYYEIVRHNLLIDEENRMIKGKVLFWLLRDYIYQITGKNISESNAELFSKIVFKIEVDFKPVFAQLIKGIG